jgi:hypothetical protein
LVYDSLRQLQGDEQTFLQLNRVLESRMRSWPIHNNVIAPLLAELGIRLSEISHINVVAWRSNTPKPLCRQSWQKFTKRQVDTLQPGRIVTLGLSAGHYVKKLYEGPAPVDEIERSIGDKYVSPATRRDIDSIVASVKSAVKAHSAEKQGR